MTRLGYWGGINPRSYVDSNPMLYIDPKGQAAWLVPIAVGAQRVYKTYRVYRAAQAVKNARDAAQAKAIGRDYVFAAIC